MVELLKFPLENAMNLEKVMSRPDRNDLYLIKKNSFRRMKREDITDEDIIAVKKNILSALKDQI